MFKSKARGIAALAFVALFAGQFAMITVAEAKSAKCFATPVPGKPGTFIVTCTTRRP